MPVTSGFNCSRKNLNYKIKNVKKKKNTGNNIK